ncbi:TolC family protein [Hymenobacter sp. BT507]|uniref:TolC family protein n=1 Tax=Hymenobacter citatus TaxID=2763506 RepID=A0ABR7MFY7_9BACT|nr:TolC family protein [Hymenobacter citatus]MBC6609999.1 TolC family protein [Hymenobacter citatus]
MNPSSMTRRFLPLAASLALLLAGSCRSVGPVTMPRATPIPTTFGTVTDTTSVTDTVSMANQQWQHFFADPNLVALLDTAIRSNPDLGIAMQRVEAARANVFITRGAMLPAVTGVASAGVERYGKYTLNGTGNYDTNLSPNIDGRRLIPNPTPDFFLGLRSAWELDIWGKLRNRRRAAFLRVLATEKGRQFVQTALVAEVARLYYTLLALDNELVVLGKNRALQERAVEIVKIQKAGGRATELAVQQFIAQLLRTQSLQYEARQRVVAAENELNRLLGRYPQPITRGEPIGVQPLPASVATGVPTTMLLRRPDVQQAELELTAAKADVAAARAAFLPSLVLTPYVGFNAYRTSVLLNPSSLAYGLLGGLTGPLVNRAPLRADYARSAAEQRTAYYEYQKAVQTGFEEVVTNLKGIENYQRMYELQQQEVEALNKAVDISNDLYGVNYSSYLEVITAQRNVLEAELNITKTRREQFLLLIDLYRALGGGWE